ncbi:MAG: chemotaxis protein CheB [Bacteroidetes bacterium]|nr:chemotaxis protein CheB [Bacteroidota bacterium]
MTYSAIVIGVSSGGLNALKLLFSMLPAGFSIPVIIVQHLSPRSDGRWINLLNENSKIHVKEADEKEKIQSGTAYVAPPNYHLLIEKTRTLSLSIDERVNYARPSVDVLFESAAEVYQNELIGIVLTGSNSDGAEGLKRIKENGGLTIVQDPADAESAYMPESAIATTKVDYILTLENIIALLIAIDKQMRTVL